MAADGAVLRGGGGASGQWEDQETRRGGGGPDGGRRGGLVRFRSSPRLMTGQTAAVPTDVTPLSGHGAASSPDAGDSENVLATEWIWGKFDSAQLNRTPLGYLAERAPLGGGGADSAPSLCLTRERAAVTRRARDNRKLSMNIF